MCLAQRALALVVLVLAVCAGTGAQSSPDPSGHWEGAIEGPERVIAVEIDVFRSPKGTLAGTITIPAQNITGLPLAKVSADAAGLRFQLGNAEGDRVYTGAFSADAATMAGDFTMNGFSMPLKLTRAGTARIETPAANPPIGKELEGTWNGTLSVEGVAMKILLKLSNGADGTSSGTMANLDQGALEVPLSAIVQDGRAVKLEVKAVAGSYTGTVNPEGTELTGTWTQGPLTAAITFRRAENRR